MRHLTLGLLALPLLLVMSSCATTPPNSASPTLSLVEQAALEATRIVQQAQATALLLQARAQATALVVQAGATAPEAQSIVQPANLAPGLPTTSPITLAPEATPGAAIVVQVISVGPAAEQGMLIVRFMAPVKEADKWWQGSVQVLDETDQVTYQDIPVMPIIGPLIGRPKQDGQAGYVLLYHDPPHLQAGDLVTVQLGNYTFEHIEFSK